MALTALWMLSFSLTQNKTKILDDAYITYIYARNLAEGAGLRYNALDPNPTEGSTSLLHVLLTAGGLRLGFTPLAFTRIISVLALAAAFFTLAIVWWRKMGLRLHVSAFVASTLFALTVAMPETIWHIASGLETVIYFSALLMFGLWAQVVVEHAPKGRRLYGAIGAGLFLVLGLLRPDGLVFAGLTIVMMALWVGIRMGRGALMNLVIGLAPAALATLFLIFLILLWKYYYFGSLLPNAYWVKSNNHVYGKGGTGLPGLKPVFDYVAMRMIPLAIIIAIMAVARHRYGTSRASFPWYLVVSALLLVGAYTLTIHETADGFRYTYPYGAMLLLALGWVLAGALGGEMKEGIMTGAIVLAAFVPFLMIARDDPAMKELTRELKGRSPVLLDWVDHVPDRGVLVDTALDLKATGLGQNATVLLSAAGIVPWFSRFQAVDWIGLNDGYLSGQTERSIDDVWAHIDSRKPDVVVDFLPPASPGATSYRDDPAFKSPAIQNTLNGRGTELFRWWDRDRISQMLWREMAWIRDNAAFAACYNMKSDWVIFVYVRKDSPHARRILDTLAGSTRTGCERDDFDSIYYTDPRPGGAILQ